MTSFSVSPVNDAPTQVSTIIIKEKALALTTPTTATPGRYHRTDKVLAILRACDYAESQAGPVGVHPWSSQRHRGGTIATLGIVAASASVDLCRCPHRSMRSDTSRSSKTPRICFSVRLVPL